MSAETDIYQPSPLSRFLDVLEPLLLVLVPAVLMASLLLQLRQTALLSALVATAALVPFFLRFEGAGVKPRDIMPIVVMAAIAIVLRIVTTPIFYLHPSSAIIIMAGLGFGRRSGFMTGALVAIVSNLFLGQGPWTPWQMYAWGLMGYAAGALANTPLLRQRWQVCVFSGVMALVYNLLLDTYAAFGFMGGDSVPANAVAVYIAGISYAFTHVASTVPLVWLIYKPWMSKFVRIKAKYGVGAGAGSFEQG